MQRTIIILSGGGPGPAPATLPDADYVIAADSGLELATGLGLEVDLLVGDMDSVAPDLLAAAANSGTRIERHPPDKDATDLDLALQAAIAHGAGRIVVVGGGSGRLDHLLGVATLVASPRWRDVSVEWHTPDATAYAVHDTHHLATAESDIISVIPLGGDATVTLTGTRWELDQTRMPFGSTLGISNEATGTEVALQIHSGIALLVRSPA